MNRDLGITAVVVTHNETLAGRWAAGSACWPVGWPRGPEGRPIAFEVFPGMH